MRARPPSNGQARIVTPQLRRALVMATQEAESWADARIPGAGHRHYMIVPTMEQADAIDQLERFKERLRASR